MKVETIYHFIIVVIFVAAFSLGYSYRVSQEGTIKGRLTETKKLVKHMDSFSEPISKTGWIQWGNQWLCVSRKQIP